MCWPRNSGPPPRNRRSRPLPTWRSRIRLRAFRSTAIAPWCCAKAGARGNRAETVRERWVRATENVTVFYETVYLAPHLPKFENSNILQALAHPTRIAIVEILRDGELSAGAMQERLDSMLRGRQMW